ncbi:hypothetical protein Vadar_010820 [Vaccinium darrowii]|uniref:Uncharacterized protein n=1 Tax=Vaccinium darrowii TaxID=229202 RepID=A0ACB7XHX8_9ERIC|nr:hypothetical protein Vadar_010820 [Vaccinium darrowii]
MYSSNQPDYQKPSAYSTPPPPSSAPPPYAQPPYAPEQYGGPSVGIPVMGSQPGPWSTGLCDCCDDVPNCCITCWCPCITFGQIAGIVDKGSTSCGVSGALYTLIAFVTGVPCVYSCCYRSKMRQQYTLHESPCADCCVHFCCETCALCQEYRELKNRGFDMSIGWEGNVQKQRREMAMAPMPQGGMTRDK